MCGGGAVGGAPGPHLPKGVRPNKSARSRNTAVTTAADAKTRPQSPGLEAPATDAAARGHAAAACPGPAAKPMNGILIGIISIGKQRRARP